jgi:hypothetical protein
MRCPLFALPVALLLFAPALANAADPPGRVGRLSYMDGTVSFHLAGQQADWSPATVNYPVTTGESFWTEPNSRAEIQVGPAELRLDQGSQLDIAKLDDRSTDFQLDQGVLNLHLWQMPAGEVSVTTPRGRIAITAPGSYDIDAGQPNGDQPSDQVQVTVLEGAARFEGDRGAVEIGHSEAAVISGDPTDVQLVASNSSDFDNWALARERREDVAQKPTYVPPAVTGYQDLAQYGSWNPDPDYGQVWYPSDVPAGWAPYRYGHWAFVPPWGWTWIDDSPWGFAPFHYGRWIDRDDRWAWVPQDIPPQPVYAPALVAFVGGDGWGIDLAAGASVAAVGWVVLAPHESYHPDYRASAGYERNLNGRDWNTAGASGRSATMNNFRNRDAATVVPAAAFTRAAPVQRSTVAVAPDQLARTRTTTALTSFTPSPLARIGRADPAAATAAVPEPNAKATVARGRVAATTPANAGAQQQQVPTAPGPHRVANADTHAPMNGPAATATPAPQRAQNAPNPSTPNQPPSNQPGTNQPPRAQTRATPNAPANANLAPHPAPPHPAPPSAAATNARPDAAARPGEPTHPTPAPQQAARPPQDRAAAPTPPVAPRTAVTQPNPPTPPSPPRAAAVRPPTPAPAAPPPTRQAAALPHPPAPPARPAPTPVMQVPHPEQQTHIAPAPQAWTRAPGPPPRPAPQAQPVRAPAPPPPAPHPAAPPPAAHPAAAPAAHPAAPAKAPPAAPDKKQQPPQ